MSAVSPIQTSINAGELTPRLNGRVDQNVRSIGLAKMLGFIPLLQGGGEAAPGTIFVAMAKGPFRTIPFEFNVTQTYMIEAGDTYFRFYTNDDQIMDGADPYEIATPFSYAQVQSLYWAQDYDALYLAVRAVPLQRLIRTGADTFELDAAVMKNGPLEPTNSDKTITVSASATTGNAITITASEDMFEAGDVGGIMEIECTDLSGIPGWEPGIKIDPNPGYLIQWNGNVYVAAGGYERTGNVAPIHTEGTEMDGAGGKDINDKGPYGVNWTYSHDRYGMVKFTGFTNARTMTATVLRTLATTGACYRWRFGRFSPRRGFPQAVALWGDRLAVGMDSRFDASVAEALDDFSIRNEFGDISQDMALAKSLDNPNAILAMLGETQLLIMTGKSEHAAAAGSAGSGIGPGNVEAPAHSHYGSAAIRPIAVDGRLVYVQRSRRQLMQMVYDNDRLLRQESPDLSRYADHITGRGIADIAWAQQPANLFWLVLDDGTMAACAYNPDEQLLGFCRRELGGGLLARSVAAIPSPDASYDQIWIAAQRGSDWMMLRMAPIRRTGDPTTVIMSDAAVIYEGVATKVLAAPHLAGQAVEIVADSKVHPPVVLDAAGNGVLDYVASEIVYGLPFPAFLQSFSPDSGAPGGTGLGKLTRVNRVDVEVLDADGLQIECQGQTKTCEQLQGDSLPDTAFPLASGTLIFESIGRTAERSVGVTIRRYLPKPSTIVAIASFFEKGER